MKTIVNIIFLSFITLIIGCQDEALSKHPKLNNNQEIFLLSEAKTYFKENANDLSPLSFSTNQRDNKTIQTSRSKSNPTDSLPPATSLWTKNIPIDLIPLWEDAIYSEKDSIAVW